MNLDKFDNLTLGAFWRKYSVDPNSSPKIGLLEASLTNCKDQVISFICSEDLDIEDSTNLFEFVDSVFSDGSNPDHVFGTELTFVSAKGMENLVAVWRDSGICAFACNMKDRERLAILLGNVITGKLKKGDDDE